MDLEFQDVRAEVKGTMVSHNIILCIYYSYLPMMNNMKMAHNDHW